jgi:hypothetical protein
MDTSMRVAAVALGALVLALGVSSPVYAASTANLRLISINDDRFYNYDFTEKTVSSSKVDWPVDMIFCHNADVNKVKSIYFGATISAWPMYMYLSDNGITYLWDEDRGTKNGMWWSLYLGQWVKLHMRVYAPNPPDYFTNTSYLKMVVGTSHYDEYPWESWSGYSEYAESDLRAIAIGKGYQVFGENVYLYNYEANRWEGSHFWQNSGYASRVCIT